MQRQKHLIVIGGATATGKTATAIQVAAHFKAEILSADSRQFYREMQIGTAKPTPEELAKIPHHFINSLSVKQEYSVGDFETDALILLEQLFHTNDVAMLVGGSGLFIRALCEGLDAFPEVPKSAVKEQEDLMATQGIGALQAALKELDPIYYEQVDLKNPMRLIRALSVCTSSGLPFSSFRSQEKKKRFFKPIYVNLEVERNVLYERINNRVDEMLHSGLVEEARGLYPFRQLNALQTVGYLELFEFFDGMCSLEAAVAKIKQNTRNYAKRQVTWFKKEQHWAGFNPTNVQEILSFLASKIGGSA